MRQTSAGARGAYRHSKMWTQGIRLWPSDSRLITGVWCEAQIPKGSHYTNSHSAFCHFFPTISKFLVIPPVTSGHRTVTQQNRAQVGLPSGRSGSHPCTSWMASTVSHWNHYILTRRLCMISFLLGPAISLGDRAYKKNHPDRIRLSIPASDVVTKNRISWNKAWIKNTLQNR